MNWMTIKDAVDGWFRHKCARLGAALAYYSVFSLGPLLLIVTGVAGLMFGEEAVRGALSAQLRSVLGHSGGQAIEAMLKGASASADGIWATASGAVLLLVAAVGVVAQLKDALNTICEAEDTKHEGFWAYARTYLVSLAGILGLGFLLAVTLVISTALTAVSQWLESSTHLLWQTIDFILSLVVLSVLFALLFRYFPDSRTSWRGVWTGAIATALMFNAGKSAISWYVGSQALESTYGAAASIVVLLIWVYYSAQIVLFGGELSCATARAQASRPTPDELQHKGRNAA